ncbi:hypothetical protein RHSP_41714 (plasmid) [Rhizobium freirei PRF 81]|uniref:Uncharacterized protein n=1 Tax=Rhizobium freirei PRF 81 TaxID=363754 RepID=N6UQ56_9HYPH|nr:sarcosine oxidase subunit gamma family protein [Rhizobium freirei]ENN83875.1 hypothetical protein RHSP_41714 [Rhizobium freirei PRF 81]
MVDHARKWDAAPDWSTAKLIGKDIAIWSIELPDQTLVSGDLAAFGRNAEMDGRGVGTFGHVDGEAYTIRLARDRLLAVGRLPQTVREGWNEAGFAITSFGGANHVFELSGEGQADLLARATSMALLDPGYSASVGFAFVPSVLYRHGPLNNLRLHVERGLAVYVWAWLKTVLEE